MTDTILKKTIYLRATPEKVWTYLTDPEKLAIWFHKPTNTLLDGEYEMFGTESGKRLMWGKVLIAEPFSRLEDTFSIAPIAGATSTVKWQLDEVPGGTMLSLQHEGLPQGEDTLGLTLALDKGWDEHLAHLRNSIHDA